jgi:hypothetical protein
MGVLMLSCTLIHILFGFIPASSTGKTDRSLFYIFWRAFILFSTVVVLIYFPTKSVWVFLIATHPGKQLVIFCDLNDGHSTRSGMKSWPGFDLYFHYVWSGMLSISSFFSHLDFFRGKISVQIFDHFLFESLFFWELNSLSSLCILVINPLS